MTIMTMTLSFFIHFILFYLIYQCVHNYDYWIIPLLSIATIYEGYSCTLLHFSCCMGCPGVFRTIYASFVIFENALALGSRF